jgi:hypothetical protein
MSDPCHLSQSLGFAFAVRFATTHTVTTIADSGAGSLRQAILDANGAAGTHIIAFNILGSGPHSIAPVTDLPAIAFLTGITIDGTTQPGFAGTPLIEIYRDGTFASTCLTIQGTPTTIKALAINRCGMAIYVTSPGALTLLGTRIGTDPSGTVALGNAGVGVYITSGSPDNVIGGPNPGDRNIFSNHASSSALAFAFSSSGTVRGNYFGVAATAPDVRMSYLLRFTGAAAEMSRADIKTLMQVLSWAPSWTP